MIRFNINKSADYLKYLPFAVLYFFFNSFLLPEGLLYTALLTPFFLWWLCRRHALRWLGYFFLFTVPFIPLHLYQGVEPFYYLRSYLLFFTSFTFGVCFYIFLKSCSDVSAVFRQLLLVNFLLIPVALLALLVPALKDTFWYLKEISPGIGGVPRLKMLTYEASYYSLLLVPLALYYYLKLLLFRPASAGWLFLMVTLPLVLSFSLGVTAGILLALAGLFLYDVRLFLFKKNTVKIALASLLAIAAVLLVLLWRYPDNPLFGRIANIFNGRDTSFRGRTYESFILAWKIASQKSVWFGCGPGQAKIVGVQVFHDYYGYLPPVVRIPNTLGDTLATYGMTGVFIRLALTVYFFFRTRVHRNYYRLAIFLFMFIYQFTGSFITNIAEYIIWILAFTNVFEEFDKKNVLQTIQVYKLGKNVHPVSS